MNILQFDPSKSILLIAEDIFISIHGHCIGQEMQKALIERVRCYFRVGRKIGHSSITASVISAASELYIADSHSKSIFTQRFIQRSDEYMTRFGRNPTVEKAPKNRFSIGEFFSALINGFVKS